MHNFRLTLTEAIVAAIVVLALIVIAMSCYPAIERGERKSETMKRMRDLGMFFTTYTTENAGVFPAEDAPGGDTWENAAKAEANDTWYNALPRMAG